MSGGFVSLGSWGRVEVSGISAASVETVSGDVVELPPDVARDLGTTLFWLDEPDGLLLLIPRAGSEIVRVDLGEGVVREVEWLVRDEDEDLRFASARPGPGGTLLVLYERGLVCLDPRGAVRWHALHDDLSAEIVAVDDDRVVLRQQWPYCGPLAMAGLADNCWRWRRSWVCRCTITGPSAGSARMSGPGS
jgi:hypothetical protein